MRAEEQLRSKAKSPGDYLRDIPEARPALAQGASVSCETMLGFLAAIESLLPSDTGSPLLEAARVWFETGPDSRLFIEAGTGSVWSAVALDAKQAGQTGFSVAMPVRRAMNVLGALRTDHETVVVGVDDIGVCLGPYTIPFAGQLAELPSPPAINSWAARAVMPAAYFDEICTRVLPARSQELSDPALQRILVDFEHYQIDGEWHILCTAVATDGEDRFHIMRLPHATIQMETTRSRALPSTCTVSGGFFRYLREIVNGKVVGLEFSSNQVVAKGSDFIVVATVSTETGSQFNDLVKWRDYDYTHPGYWLVSRDKLLEAVRAGAGAEVTVTMDGLRESLRILMREGAHYQQEVEAQCFDGPPIATVTLDRDHFIEAVTCCGSGLIRIEIAHRDSDQASKPVVIRGEDEQFKAVLQPR